MGKRYTIVMQVAEVDEQGETVETFEVMGPAWASTDLEAVREMAVGVESNLQKLFPDNVDLRTVSKLFPEEG